MSNCTLHTDDITISFHTNEYGDFAMLTATSMSDGEQPIILPREIIEAATQGWDMECPECESTP